MRLSILVLLLLLVLLPSAAFAQDATLQEYNFDLDSQGWDCHTSSGYLWPNPVCSSPVINGVWADLSAVVFAVGDVRSAVVTARVRDNLDAVLCERSVPVEASQQTRLDLFCGAVSGPVRLEVVEGAGDFVIDFVRVDLRPAVVPTAPPAPTAIPSPTAIPAVVMSEPLDPRIGMVIQRTAIPSPTATPDPAGDCVVYVRLADRDTGQPVYKSAQLRLLNLTGEHYRTVDNGFGVYKIPCGDFWLSVVGLDGLLLNDPHFVTLAGVAKLDLLIQSAPVLEVSPLIEAAPMVDSPPVEAAPVEVAPVEVAPATLPPNTVAYVSGVRGAPLDVVAVPVVRSGFDLSSIIVLIGVLLLVGFVVYRVWISQHREVSIR